jgi:membrane-bound ClpP family serine protease
VALERFGIRAGLIADPHLALLAGVLGLAGICLELCSPGRVIPGVAGGVLLAVAVDSFAAQALRTDALLLLAGGAGALAGAVFTRARWRFATGAAALLGLAFARLTPAAPIHPAAAAAAGAAIAYPAALLGSAAWQARRRKRAV